MIKKASKQKEINQILEVVSSIHLAADYYQNKGLSPLDFIISIPGLASEVEAYKAIDPKCFDFISMTWGAACQFIITHSEDHKYILKLFKDIDNYRESYILH